jgi:hypothetical protein
MAKRFPKWAFPVARLTEFAKGRRLAIRPGGKFFLVFFDFDDPMGHVVQRPHTLQIEEDNRVWGNFQLFDPYDGKPIWAFAPYYRELSAFGYECPPTLFYLGTALPDLVAYDEQERELVRKKWVNRKEKDSWLESQLLAERRSLRKSKSEISRLLRGSPLQHTSSSKEKARPIQAS